MITLSTIASLWSTLKSVSCFLHRKSPTLQSSETKSGKFLRKKSQSSSDFHHSHPRRLASSQIEEYIVKENFKGAEDYYIKFEEFVQRLKIPADDVSYTLFRMFANPSESVVQDVIDFKEYLFHALFLIKLQEPKIELVRVLFMVSRS
jgi:hypothetical protein